MGFKNYIDFLSERPLNEAVYSGNIGVMETVKFYQMANKAQIRRLEQLIDRKSFRQAWDLIQTVTGVTLKKQ